MPIRIQRKREAGWRLPENTVCVDRTSRWGNPFRVGDTVCLKTARKWAWKMRTPDFVCETAEVAVRRFSACLGLDDCMIAEVKKHLRGKDLACFCDEGDVCHADILLEIANE